MSRTWLPGDWKRKRKLFSSLQSFSLTHTNELSFEIAYTFFCAFSPFLHSKRVSVFSNVSAIHLSILKRFQLSPMSKITAENGVFSRFNLLRG